MKYRTHQPRSDGFGRHYKAIILTYVYCMYKGYTYVYRPLGTVAHNYDNDSTYVDRLENLINVKPYLKVLNDVPCDWIKGKMIIKDIKHNPKILENNIKPLRDMYWKNKEMDFFKNDKINISVHIRKGNKGDKLVKPIIIQHEFYLKIIDKLKHKYSNTLFHIYSQGHENDFLEFKDDNTIFHLNEDIVSTFQGMVAANVLVISESALSYTAGLISSGEVHCTRKSEFTPLSSWIRH